MRKEGKTETEKRQRQNFLRVKIKNKNVKESILSFPERTSKDTFDQK